MADYSVKVNADVSNYNNNIDSAAGATKKFQDAADDANKTLNDLGQKGAKSAKDLLKEMQNLEKGGRSVSNYRAKLSRLQKDIADLTINYRAMSKEMQNSDLGRETVLKIQELTKEAANYKDAILDAQASIKALASDTANLDAMKSGLDLVSGAMQSVAAMGILSADSTEKLVKVIGTLKSIESGFNGVQKVMTALQRESGLMMGIQRLQTAALTKATQLQTAATGKATIAQKLFNAVAKANPYVLLAAAIAALVVGIGSYIAITKKSTNAADEAARATKRFTKALEEGKTEANSTIAKFLVLQSTWKSLRTEAEKIEWIKKNQDEFKELGLNIKDVNDAEKAFVRYSTNIIKAMALRAQAAKLAAQAEKEMEKALNDADKQQRKTENAANDFRGLTKKDIKKYGLQEGVDYVLKSEVMRGGGEDYVRKWFEPTPAGREKLKQAGEDIYQSVIDGAEERVKPAVEKMNELISQAEALESPLGPIVDDASKVDDTIKAAEGSLTAANQKLSEMKTKFEAMSATDPGFDKMKKDVQDQEKLVERLKKKYETMKKGGEQIVAHNSRLSQLKDELASLNKIEPALKEGTAEWDAHYKRVAEIEKEIKDLEGAIESYKKRINSEPLELVKPISENNLKLPNFVTNTAFIDLEKKAADEIEHLNRMFAAGFIDKKTLDKKIKEVEDRLKKAKLEIEAGVRIKPLSNEEKRTLYDAKAEAASIIQKDFDLGLISQQQAQAMIDNINSELKKAGIKAEVSLEVDIKNLNTQVSDALKEYVTQFDKIGGVANGVVGSFNDIYESVTGLSERLDEADNAWESFYATFQAGMSIFNAFTTIVESVATALEVLNLVKDAGTLATERESSSLRKNTKERLKNAMASGTQSALESGESVSSVPYVGPILAAAAIATILGIVMAAMSKAKAYRTGGIVGGSDYNDGILARVSSGEMILNKDQQANLFKLLDSPSAGLGGKEVEFKIRGTELVGVLNNINKKNSKI